MKKNSSIYYLLFIILGLVALQSCSEGGSFEDIEQKETTLKSKNEDKTDVSMKMAKAVSILMSENNEWRDFIIKRAQERENGDQVFLYGLAKDETINGKTLHEALTDVLREDGLKIETELLSHDVVNQFPILSIAMNGDEASKKLKVYVDHRNDDGYTDEEIVSYYVDGKLKKQKYAKVNKKGDTYLIIRDNERVVTSKEMKNREAKAYFNKEYPFTSTTEAFLGTANNIEFRLKFPVDHFSNNEFKIKGSNDAIQNSGGCYRDWTTKRDGVTAYRTSNDYDGGFNGSGEFRVRYILTNLNGDEIRYSAAVNNIKDDNVMRPFGNGFDAFHWDESYHGDRARFVAWEEDSGGPGDTRFTGSLNTEIAGITINIAFNFGADNDDLIGDIEVDYCSGNPNTDDGTWRGIGDASFYMGAIFH